MNQNELKTMKATVQELRRKALSLEAATSSAVSEIRRRADMLERIIETAEKEKAEIVRRLEGRPKAAKPISQELGKLTHQAIGHYCEAWKKKYNAQTLLTKAGIGQLQGMVKEFGLEKVKHLIDAFFNMNDTWFVKKRHDLICLKQNIQSVNHFAETGVVVTNTKLNQMDRMSDLQSMSQRVLDGEL